MRNFTRSAVLIGSLLCVGFVQAAPYKVSRASDPTITAERAAKANQVHVPSEVVPTGTANYAGTTTGGPSWSRPFADCTGTSALGPVVLHTQTITPTVTGAHTISSVQDGWDGYMFIYSSPFDPAAPNTNCIAGNDDAAGIGTSEIANVALTAGTSYIVVTTGFEAGEEGTFTNTIDGPGAIIIGAGGLTDLVSITKTAPDGIATSGAFTYVLQAQTVSATAAAGVVVTDVLPAGLTYVSNTCGATVAAGTLTWNVGTLAGSSSSTCTVTVQNPSSTCALISNTATITTTDPENSLANNTSTVSNGTSGGNAVVDGGFEAGVAGAAWAATSTNFGTPVCDVTGCGNGTGTGPRTGTFWTWFGGAPANTAESGSMQQSVVVPNGSTAITFWVEFPICANTTDFVRLTIDGTEVWRADGTSALCGVIGYSQVSVPLAGFANGAAHAVRFESTTSGVPGGSNFFIDDVEIAAPPTCTTGASPADLSLSKTASTTNALVGDTVTYTLTASNAGPGAVASATVVDTLPAGLTYVSNSCGATFAAPTLTWNVAALAVGASTSCSLVTTITPGTSGSVINSATISSGATDPVTVNNTGSSSVTVGEATAVPAFNLVGLLALMASLGGFAWYRSRSIG